MSWFDKGFANLAKTALKEAQKQIDKALDIREEEENVSGIINNAANKTTNVKNEEKKSKTVPNTPSFGGNKQLTTSNWGSFTGSFFDNPNASETPAATPIRIAPKSITTSIQSLAAANTTSSSTAAAITTTKTTQSLKDTKRHSVTSNSDSVDLLSPSVDVVLTPSEANVSESVDLITTSVSEITTPDDLSSICGAAQTTTDSIVIIGSNEIVDDEEDSLSFNTVMDETLTAQSTTLAASFDDTRELSSCGSLTPRATVSQDNKKLLLSKDDIVLDSDSTQSFEDVQMLTSTDSNRELSLDDKFDLNRMIMTSTTSYSSPHNSNDEIETNTTTTSSDIEIISNPNGDSSSTHSATTRICPTRMKKLISVSSAAAHCGSGNGSQTSASTNKGHCREPSEISVLSEDSQTEIDKLSHRISELTEHLEARESQLLQCERQNSVLQEQNIELQSLVDSLRSNTANLDTSSDDYTQRLSALEKKFQASIRERDALRIQIQALKDELRTKVPKEKLDLMTAERDAMIAELHLEGDKLTKEILQQSNIIKKLRAKEKSSDALLKRNTIQIEELTDETERLKKSLNAKEDMERTQIEAVHKMSSEKRKLEDECAQQRSKIEDLQMKLETMQASFDAVKDELQQRTRVHMDLTRKADEVQETTKVLESFKTENQSLRLQIIELKEKLRSSEQALSRREQQLREENKQLLDRLEAAELRAENSTQEISQTTIPLMRQLESLQNTLSQRSANWNKEEKMLLEKLDASQSRLKSLEHVEANYKEKFDLLQARCLELEEKLSNALVQSEQATIALHQAQMEYVMKEGPLNEEINVLSKELEASKVNIKTLETEKKSLEERLTSYNNQLSIVKSSTATTHSSTDDLLKHKLAVTSPLHMTPSSTDKEQIMQSQQQTQLQQVSQFTQHSPTNSFGVNSIEEALGGGGSYDWHADDSDCASYSGARNPLNLLGNINFLGHSTSTIEHLQSLLKQRDGELHHLQWEMSRMQSERSVLNTEISNLTLEFENLKEKLQLNEALEANFNDLQHRYDELLQMYGEKVERTEELELDLYESREAYKKQIEEILAQQSSSSSSSTSLPSSQKPT